MDQGKRINKHDLRRHLRSQITGLMIFFYKHETPLESKNDRLLWATA